MVRILDLYISGYKILLALEYYKLVTKLTENIVKLRLLTCIIYTKPV